VHLLLLALACGPEDASTDPPAADTDDTDVAVDDTDPVDPPGPTTPFPCGDDVAGGVSTTTGCVTGTTWAHGEAFFGIPYAEPPVGPRRWARPVAVAPWEAPLAATSFGAVCPQSSGTIDGELAAGEGSEDCLTLNVWRPSGASGLPILFFIHGGSHTDGAGSQAVYADDPGLARSAIVVTHNYRLGPLGFLAHPGLSAVDAQSVSGNQGLRDSLLALRWVRDNAAALGGDPDQILVFGESAGGLSACALWMSPEADGLMAGVLTQSAPCSVITRQMAGGEGQETGEEQGERLARELQCHNEDDVVGCMRDRTLSDVLEALPTALSPLAPGAESWGLVVDGAVVPAAWSATLDAGLHNDVPLHIGVMDDEARLFTASVDIASVAAYRLTLLPFALIAGTSVDTLFDIWPPADFGGDPKAAFTAFYGDIGWVCPSRRVAADVAALGGRAYLFARPLLGAQAVGATHGLELPYVFGTLGALAPAVDLALSDTVQAAWTSLATGAPAVPGLGPWPSDAWLHVRPDASVGETTDIHNARCDAYDAVVGGG
jgi:para-nitrobenzyl esterase